MDNNIFKTMGQRAFGGKPTAKRPLSPVACPASPKKQAAAPPTVATDNTTATAADSQPKSPARVTGARQRIPPLFVAASVDWPKTAAALDGRLTSDFRTTARGNFFRLHTTTVEDFRAAQRYFSREKVPFHTFCVGRPLNLKVVISGLPKATTDLQLLDELGAKNFEVEEAIRLRSRRGPSSSWLVTLCPDSEAADDPNARKAREIYDLTELFRLRVLVSSYRRPTGPRQCHRCQGLEHGSGNCGHPIRCVRCGGPHTASQCRKPRGEAGLCCNCGGAHNANYRGCPIFKEWRTRRLPQKSTQPTAQAATQPQAEDPESMDVDTAGQDEGAEEITRRRRGKRQPRNPANRHPGPSRETKKKQGEPPEEPPGPGPTFQRATPRLRLDWPPGKARAHRPAMEQPAPASQSAPASQPAADTTTPDLRTMLVQLLRQLTALVGKMLEEENARQQGPQP